MKIEDFGFTPEMGKEYVVNFSSEGELLNTSIYNGSPLPAVSFPDNKKIDFTITDKETGTNLMSTEFISYNGKLYKSVFNLPLKNPINNENANVYIQDLHYDLTTGSVLVKVQGFQGDKYNLLVSDTTVQHKVMTMPITLEDDTYYSIATELVQNNEFEVVLQDEFGKSIDSQVFTAPISTDWRYTNTVEDGTLELDQPLDENSQDVTDGQVTGDFTDPLGIDQSTGEGFTTEQGLDAEAPFYKDPVFLGIGIGALVMLLLLIILIKRRNARRSWGVNDGGKKGKGKGKGQDDEDEDEYDDIEEDGYPAIDEDEEEEFPAVDEENEDEIPRATKR